MSGKLKDESEGHLLGLISFCYDSAGFLPLPGNAL